MSIAFKRRFASMSISKSCSPPEAWTLPMSSRFRIDDLTLDTGRRLLLRDAQPITLGPLTYRLLLTLVEAAPNVVTHDELVQSIWGGRPVSPETLSQRVKLLRDALSDDPGSPRYVEGVRGQGYRPCRTNRHSAIAAPGSGGSVSRPLSAPRPRSSSGS